MAADNPFVHLHCHSDYSLLDGCAHIDKMMARAAKLGMPALALTDHGNLFGAVEFYKAGKKNNVKPILGCEVYLVIDHGIGDRPKRTRPQEDDEQEKASETGSSAMANKIYHMGLLARNNVGWKNLCKLVSKAHLYGMHYRPRVDFATLTEHAEGLIGFSGCMQGVIPQHLMRGEKARAKQWCAKFIEVFGRENYYVELQEHGLVEQHQLNLDLLEIAKDFDLKVFCSNDSHYVEQGHSVPHDMLLCIQTGKRVNDEKRMRFDNNNFYMKSGAEMESLFGHIPGALTNTLEIAERCDLKLEFGVNHYPVFKLDEDTKARCQDNPTFLKELCIKGFLKRYGVDYNARATHADPAYAEELCKRLDFELTIIGKTGFIDYFLIVQDFINWAKDRGIPVGPGRGSGAGCMVAYVLGITDTDPMRFRLLFERMLNLERVSPPDFDIDFCMRRRDEVIEYVRNKYGADCVSNIITFGTFGAKTVIRDLARVTDFPFAEADRIAKMVPENPDMTIEKALANSAELAAEIQRNPTAKQIFDHGRVIEGMARNTGRHAAGIIICDQPLIEQVPVTLQEGAMTTQFEKGAVEDLGLLKMDFLGLKTLTVISDAETYIKQTANPTFDLNAVPFDDPRTYALMRDARTVGVFQMESGGMQSLCRQLEVANIDEIVALIALYRPGPMDWIPDYIKGKKDPASIKFPHPLLTNLLRETYGVMVYQEQVMEAAKILAGYSLGGADILRRAMGKKKPEEMEKQKGVFVKGCKEHHNIDEKTAVELFSILEKFAGYGFNKSHSAAYAILTYRTAYLKANYPLQFMAGALTCELGHADNLAKFLDEGQAMNVTVEGPNINHSREQFYPRITKLGAYYETGNPSDEGTVLFGLGGIKGVGEGAAQKIIEEREKNGPYKDFKDFITRVDSKAVNRRVIEALIKTGAFDALGEDRGELLHNVDSVMSEAASAQKDRERGQTSLFDMMEPAPKPGAGKGKGSAPAPSAHRMPLNEMLQFEKELLGFYVSGHPLNAYRGLAEHVDTFKGDDYRNLPDRTPFRLCGVVSKIDKKISKKDNRPWAIVTLSTRSNNYSLNYYADSYDRCQSLLVSGALLVVLGSVNQRNGESILSGDNAGQIDGALPAVVNKLTWIITPGAQAEDFIRLLRAKLDKESGPVYQRIGFLVEPEWAAVADIAGPLRWRLTAQSFQEIRKHPAVVDVLVECPPPVAREPEWKRRAKAG
ncbi:MAG: DNA polymerase III subunit alpha [Verrucomicrobiota bacterium]|nr:DNA polymerase III subunit alpha [Verrucomicrobiota bacterium]